jgi:hypothetical protein
MTEVGHSQHQKTETLESSGTLRISKGHLDANQHKTEKKNKENYHISQDHKKKMQHEFDNSTKKERQTT